MSGRDISWSPRAESSKSHEFSGDPRLTPLPSSYALRLLSRHPRYIFSHDNEGNVFPRLYNLAPWSPVLKGPGAYFQPLNLIPTPLIKIQHQIVRPHPAPYASLMHYTTTAPNPASRPRIPRPRIHELNDGHQGHATAPPLVSRRLYGTSSSEPSGQVSRDVARRTLGKQRVGCELHGVTLGGLG